MVTLAKLSPNVLCILQERERERDSPASIKGPHAGPPQLTEADPSGNLCTPTRGPVSSASQASPSAGRAFMTISWHRPLFQYLATDTDTCTDYTRASTPGLSAPGCSYGAYLEPVPRSDSCTPSKDADSTGGGRHGTDLRPRNKDSENTCQEASSPLHLIHGKNSVKLYHGNGGDITAQIMHIICEKQERRS